jgi:hypothetical protein
MRAARILVALALAVSAVSAVSAAGTAPARAHGKMHCNDPRPDAANGYGAFDPIAFPGREPAGHEHAFFGNNAALSAGQRAKASYRSLVGQSTDCSNPGDSAVYWVPSFYQRLPDGSWRRMRFRSAIAYFRPWHWPRRSGDQNAASPTGSYPPDLRMIAGDGSSTRPQPTSVVNWNCNVASSRPGRYTDLVQAACHTATGPVVRAGFHVDFPSCWTGRLNQKRGPGNTADFTDRTGDRVLDQLTRVTGTSVNPVCTTGYDRRLPSLRLSVQLLTWDGRDYRGDGRDVALSSGPRTAGRDLLPRTADDELVPGAVSQWTLHADFWNTWAQGLPGSTSNDLRGMVGRCINTASAHPHGSTVVCGT